MKTAMQQALIELKAKHEANKGTEFSTPYAYSIALLEEHLQTEKQQIIESFKRGIINEMNGIEEITSEQYYNETFN